MDKDKFREILKERGQRFTGERYAILQKALSYRGHFDPETLYLLIRKAGAKASRASVYRTLSVLLDCGVIRQVRKTEHGTVYESTYGHSHHDHMLCIQCGDILEFYSRELEKIQERICKKQGFHGSSHTLEIRGYCKKCRKKKN